ncbi:hypothetical protein [Pseudooctadecabacter jejudonensis]|uniref:Dihydroorotate dehydrogenase n=1 Tax=Pseudooctadecabacter jejudonensis TaxID=1391910 RepID=A0A1Y5RRA4_9RHOB|nr:hypothetical protein [Pseudooctadecabacter jejudonensis]SLN23250.1 hypothetical protein PSJ8397_00978 [Pseudooctadecabacter jejudonensis]
MTPETENDLDDLFADLAAEDVPVSDALLDRVMMDADAVLAASAPQAPAPVAQGLGAMLLEAIGGWPAFGGLAAATVAGVWLGVSPPAALSPLTESLGGSMIEVPLLDGDLLSALEG